MINKDYILRIAERYGRFLAIMLHLRAENKHEEALMNIDELFLQTVGLSTGFINSASEEMLLNMISPLGVLNVEKCLWIAVLLKEEGEIFAELGKSKESYYRYLKALHLFLEVELRNYERKDLDIASSILDTLNKLAEYELPLKTNGKLFRYFEKVGSYARAEDVLFEMLETGESAENELVDEGTDFYKRLLLKSDADLKAGNVSRAEVEKGLDLFRQSNYEAPHE